MQEFIGDELEGKREAYSVDLEGCLIMIYKPGERTVWKLKYETLEKKIVSKVLLELKKVERN